MKRIGNPRPTVFTLAAIIPLFLAAGAGAAPASASSPMPLAQSLHVRHYDLDLAFHPAAKSVSGTVAIRFDWQAGAAVGTLPVDLVQAFEVHKVMLDGRPVGFTHRDDVIAVALPALSPGTTHTLVIGYRGKPTMQGIHFGVLDGRPVIASYGMPYSAKQWWPNLDEPALKADSADIAITVPAGLIVASNGTLTDIKALVNGRNRYHWTESAPIYPDVISVAIAPYVEIKSHYKSITGRRIPLVYYVYKADRAKVESEFDDVPSMLHTYERLFGSYPFQNEKYGIAEFPIPSFREHQTLPSLGRGLMLGTAPVWDLGNVTNVIAHDMAHQWFGDSLTLESWSDVWLNEGFATYAVALWREAHDGEAAYKAFMQSLDRPAFAGSVYVRDDTSVHALLTPTTFNKGAWVLHMLRHVMGDQAFFAALHDYVRTHRGGLVNTQTWIAACERAYGKSLDWFFREWVYGTGRPALQTAWHQRDGRLLLDVEQIQHAPAFTMPVDVTVKTAAGDSVQRVWLRHRHETIKMAVQGRVEKVVLDPDDWLLKTVAPTGA